MRVFDYKKLEERKWNNDIIVKIAEIHEAKGRQDFIYLKNLKNWKDWLRLLESKA